MSVEWNGARVLKEVRAAASDGLTAVAIEAEGIARTRMPPARISHITKSGKTVWATPSSDPSGYPGKRLGDLARAIQTRPSTPESLRAAFGVFGGAGNVPAAVSFNVSGNARGYPFYLETKTTQSGGRRWAGRTINENRGRLERRFVERSRQSLAARAAK